MARQAWLVTLAVVVICAVGLAPTASAQAIYGNIFGTVADASGAVVPNAKVTVASIEKGTKVEATSNAAGNYTVTHLIPDKYDVRFEAAGFKAYEAKAIQVFADQGAKVDASLQVGGAAETVSVTAEDIPLIKTDRADVATTFTDKQVTEIPMLNRNFTEFQLLTPGTQKLTWQHAASENPQQSTQIFVNGQHFSGTSYQLDGTDNRDPILGIIVINPNLDAVTETKISTQNYDAEFGQALAAVITAQTRSGTNDFHGSAFWFRKNDKLQARDPFTEFAKDPITGKFKPPALWNQFGGSVGGPIIKNKLFFYGDYQGTRQKVGRSVKVTVPTSLVRSTCLNAASPTCNFSEYLTQAGAQLFNPFTGTAVGSGRTAIAGNVFTKCTAPGVPAGCIPISAAAVKLASLLPAPTVAGAIKDNFTGGGGGGLDVDGFDVRGDYNISEKLHIIGRYSLQKFTLGGKGIFDTTSVAVGGAGLGLNGFAGLSSTKNHSLAAGFDYAFSSNLLTDFRFGYFKYRVNVAPNGVGTSPASDAGAPGLNLDKFFTSGMPAFFINGGGSTGDAAFGYALSDRLTRCNCPLTENEDQFQWVNNWTKIVGNHNFKFGADIRYARNLRVPSDQHRAGELSFTNGGTGSPTVGGSGAAMASFLLGWVHDIHRYVSPTGVTDAGERQKRWFFYGQDTWRATPKLTVNYGLRWEIYFPQKVTGKGKGGWLDINTGIIHVAGVDTGSDGIVDNSYTNFAPRLGIAYQATKKTVVRLGYGRSFDIGTFGSTFGHSVTQNLPVLFAQQANAPNDFARAFDLAVGPPTAVTPPVPGPLTDQIFERILPNRMRLQTVDAWNLTVQHQITPSLSAELAYVGNKGTHVFAGNGPAFNINQATIVGFTPGRNTNLAKLLNHRYPFQTTNPVTGACTAFEPVTGLPFCWTQGIDFFGNQANNNYNALQAKIEKRFSKGFQMLAHYTWSQAFNYSDEYFPIDPRVNHGPNDLNRRHVFVLQGLWDLPIGRNKAIGGNVSRLADAIIGGWEFSNVTNISGGIPFSPHYNECGPDRDTGPCRPDKVGSFKQGTGSLDPVNHLVQYFTPVAALATNGATNGAWRRPAVGTFGLAGRNSLRGPGYWDSDLSLLKKISVTERVKSEFRFEAFNVFNHRNNGTPDVFWSEFGFGGSSCIDCSDGGQIKRLGGPMRQLQFGLKFSF